MQQRQMLLEYGKKAEYLHRVKILPALAAAVTGNGEPVSVLWIFIIAPLLGGAAAAVCYRYLAGKETE